MRFIITPDALDALRAMLDERARRGGFDDDPNLIQAWYDALCAETGNHPLLEANPPSSRRTAIFLEAFTRGSKLIKFAAEREKLTAERERLTARIGDLDRQATDL